MCTPCPRSIYDDPLDIVAEKAFRILEVEGKLAFTGDRGGDDSKVYFFDSLDESAVHAIHKVVDTTMAVIGKIQMIALDRGERVTIGDMQRVNNYTYYGHPTQSWDATLYLHRN